MLNLEVLRVIWWVILGVLFMGFAITDGFDLGVAAMFPWVAKNEDERRIVLNTIGPFWEGNQVWIILGAGAIFAAWPFVYAVAFSGAYFAVLLLLLTMGISRPVSFKYRSKLQNPLWRSTWDWMVFVGGVVPAIVFGVLLGNVMLGLPFYFDDSLRIAYSGTLISLFSPFALWCGLTSLAMLMMHGGIYLAIKTQDPIAKRAKRFTNVGAVFLILFFAMAGIWVAKYLSGYQLVSEVDHFGYSNPLHKQVVPLVGAWVQNYYQYPLAMMMPALGFLGAFGAILSVQFSCLRAAFILSSISIIGVIGTVGVSLFPFLLPSSTNLMSSLLIWDASSSRLTLLLMLFSVIIFLPIILLYTAWVYRVLGGKVTLATIEENKQAY